MIKLEYELTEKDYMDYNMHAAKNSPSVKTSLCLRRIVIPVIILTALLLIYLGSRDILYWNDIFLYVFCSSFAIAILWIFYYPKYYYYQIYRDLREHLRDTENKHLYHELAGSIVVTEEEFIAESVIGKFTYKLVDIRKVNETDNSFFIFVDTHQAFIIPKRVFPDQKSANSFRKWFTNV